MSTLRLSNPVTGSVRVPVQTGYEAREARLAELKREIERRQSWARIEAQR